MSHNHSDLCDMAVKWLQRAPGRQGPACQVAFAEAKCKWDGEIPDAIGFRTTLDDEASVVVEVKVSRADFLADRLKPHRANSEAGMGVYRYFMAPAGLVCAAELPPRWGLIEVTDRGFMQPIAGHVLHPRREQHAWRHGRSIEREWLFLAAMLGRVSNAGRLHADLKRTNTDRQRLARENDRLRSENETLRLRSYLVDRGINPDDPHPAQARAKCEGMQV